jgi:hypothetical protein
MKKANLIKANQRNAIIVEAKNRVLTICNVRISQSANVLFASHASILSFRKQLTQIHPNIETLAGFVLFAESNVTAKCAKICSVQR